ncbi:MAG TPA: hypothetical protein VM324_00150 [Egibacteraceae bacterium]|nr:hypothetical protein [Egibacteraceae bacterium]
MDLLAATADGLYRVGEGGAPERLADGDVITVAVEQGDDTDGGAVVWAVSGDTTLLRGTPHAGFAPVATSERALRCLLPLPGGVLAGTAEAGLVRFDGERLDAVAGFAHVPGRDGWYTPWGGPPDTRSLAADADGVWYAGVHVGGVPRSTDEGRTWAPTIDVDADVHEVATADGLMVAAAAYGLAVSDDGGATWAWRTDGLHARYARAVAVADATVLVSVSDGPDGRQAALYRGGLGPDGALTRCGEGLPEWFTGNVDTGCLAAVGASVGLADGGTIYRSADAGRTWEVLAEGLPAVRWLAAPTAGVR